jgi:transposase
MDYNMQSDDLDEPDEYYLLAKRHSEADALTRIERKKVVARASVPEPRENYNNFTPKFDPVPTPTNADEKWLEVVARLQRLEERALHGD